MILKRRKKLRFGARMRELIAPRKGFTRGVEYMGKRMTRLPDSPHRIALGFACGVFASFSPFFGLHFFAAAGCAWLVRGNLIASLFGTVFGNPVSFPLISAASLSTGQWVLGRVGGESGFDAVVDSFSQAFKSIWSAVKGRFGREEGVIDGLASFFHEVFVPYLIGGTLMGLFWGFVFYWLLLPLVAAYQRRRRRRLKGIRGARRRALGAGPVAPVMRAEAERRDA